LGNLYGALGSRRAKTEKECLEGIKGIEEVVGIKAKLKGRKNSEGGKPKKASALRRSFGVSS